MNCNWCYLPHTGDGFWVKIAAASPDHSTLPSSRSDGGLQSSFQIPSASGHVGICQCAQAGEACATWSFPFGLQPYLWKGANGQVQGAPWLGAKLRKFISDAAPGLPHARGMEQLLLLKPPEQWLRSPEFPGQTPSQFWLCSWLLLCLILKLESIPPSA